MKKFRFITTCLILLIGVFLISCGEDPKPTNENIIKITADINQPTTWISSKVYVIEKQDLGILNTLTIEAGTVIKLSSTYKNITIYGAGKIIANGTAEKPIVFTSYKDDSKGGDTNNDDNASLPQAGDWGTIDLNGGSGSVFKNCLFLYGGNVNTASATLDLSANAQATIDKCTFAYNGGGVNNNFYIGALNASGADNSTTIRNSIFYNNTLPLTINAEISIDNSNSFHLQENKNTYNGIFVSGNIQKDTHWQEDEVAYVITSDNMDIGIGKVLTLGNNVVLKFIKDATLNLLSGESCISNYNGDGVYFTSIKDDEKLGDTNGDGATTSPAIADWTGIFIDEWKGAGYAEWSNILYNNPNPSAK